MKRFLFLIVMVINAAQNLEKVRTDKYLFFQDTLKKYVTSKSEKEVLREKFLDISCHLAPQDV